MPQSNEVKKEHARLRMKKMRNKDSDNVTLKPESVTLDVTQYPAILHALTDPIKRRKLEKITESLKNHNQLKNVYYGYPDKGVPFDLVGDLLEVTGK